MDNYTLLPGEFVLYKGSCSLEGKNDDFLEQHRSNMSVEMILTNLNLVFVKKAKKLFGKTFSEVEIISVKDIKVYRDDPQIKLEDSSVEIFFTNGEKVVHLYSKNEARKFMDKAFELLTGKTRATRVSDKVKDAVDLIDETIGLNVADTVKAVIDGGLVGIAFGRFGKSHRVKPHVSDSIAEVVSSTQDLLINKAPQQTMEETDNPLETIIQLKELLDAGVITQEDFDAKKKQLLGL